jgi:DNA-binding IclR family transcriptional regulator
MNFPAYDDFESDMSVTPRLLKVYRWCRKHLDFAEVRPARLLVVELATGLSRSAISRSLTLLVQRGYLLEHPPTPDRFRCFTLAWARAPKAVRRRLALSPAARLLDLLQEREEDDTVALAAALAFAVPRTARVLRELALNGLVECATPANSSGPARWRLARVAASATPHATGAHHAEA